MIDPDPAARATGSDELAQTRMLFVDDEPQILRMIEMVLRSVNPDWKLAFALTGHEALALMAQERFDVIVSDMRMPGMNGAQLLNEVMQRHPATARFILSGYADEDLLMRCVGATHQYLSKPFEVNAFRSAMLRFHELKLRLKDPSIRAFIAGQRSLPSLPTVYFQILDVLRTPTCSVERVAEIVATDAGLTAKMLQLVNSAFFGFARKISGPAEAVLLLGLGRVRSLALTVHLFRAFEFAQNGANSAEQVWHHSLRVGQFAGRLVEAEAGSSTQAEQAFTAGLLHDLGKLILAGHLGTAYFAVLKEASDNHLSLFAEERRRFRATHGEVGAYLLQLWGLPVPLVEATAFHDEPMRSPDASFGPLTAVHFANAFDNEVNPSAAHPSFCALDSAYLARCGCAERLGVWRNVLEKIDSQATGPA